MQGDFQSAVDFHRLPLPFCISSAGQNKVREERRQRLYQPDKLRARFMVSLYLSLPTDRHKETGDLLTPGQWQDPNTDTHKWGRVSVKMDRPDSTCLATLSVYVQFECNGVWL